MKIYQRDKLNVLSAGTYHFIKFNVFFQGGIVPLIVEDFGQTLTRDRTM